MDIQLSICIPTYNRSFFLKQLLDSIQSSAKQSGVLNAIEVCISDNASTDDTLEMLQAFQAQSTLAIKYVIQAENKGPDFNYVQCTLEARGQYIWLMGSDDLVIESALVPIFEALNKAPNLIIMDRFDCNYEMKQQKPRHWGEASRETQIISLDKPISIQRYLNQLNSIGGIFSYLSSIIVKRSEWISQAIEPEHFGSHYVHAVKLFKIMFQGRGQMIYLTEPLVLCRGENDDTFGAKGRANRVLIDFNFYASRFISDCSGSLYASLIGVLKREWPIKELTSILRTSQEIHANKLLLRKIREIYGIKYYLIKFNPISLYIGRKNLERKISRQISSTQVTPN